MGKELVLAGIGSKCLSLFRVSTRNEELLSRIASPSGVQYNPFMNLGPMRSWRGFWTIAVGGLVLSGAAFTTPVAVPAPSNMEADEEITVKIHARRFEPSHVVLHAGQTTKLIFLNQDVELHAFVPVGLFTGVNLTIGGNGAPEFEEAGFKRVIIPSEGRVEIRFVPGRTGTFPFFCDMPGHEMRATIVVE
jgi:plastocyanin